jgi:hypothetical protein
MDGEGKGNLMWTSVSPGIEAAEAQYGILQGAAMITD